ncbi:TetR family transcriptional regulator [Streptomyces sp. e14]|uniref:TetR/AcrR family transcriptional regulator n=1 Tax=unclassified Streptomyces TaxID=2593676 RepID=UPI0001D05E23|nr:TetR/AcrR family transcriptional regulator [Streptomyces sp. e14]EFF89329.1 TetR family transcriptional regulator [Streptomyces sp. e14]NED76577.1 TetR/AcrR family transcriptional regulator [Streptomyces sp. SID9944]
MTTHRPFHHGNLRAVLLDQAERTLREGGVDALSLRELARKAGVSHGAPRSHFVDRQALLDALAERGFDRLADEVEAAIAADGADYRERLRAIAASYVHFAVTDAALLDLMFTAKNGDAPGLRAASQRLFAAVGDLIDRGTETGELEHHDAHRLQMLFAAIMQGIASLVSSRRISAQDGDALIDDAISLLVREQEPDDIGRSGSGERPRRLAD